MKTIAIAGQKMPSKESIETYLIEKDENVRILGMRQKSNPFHSPLSFELISLSFQILSKTAPALMKIVANKKAKATENSPETL